VPAVVSNALLRKLSVGWVAARRRIRPDSNHRLQRCLLQCPFEMELQMNSVTLSVRRLSELEPGQILSLPRPVDTPGALVVSGHPMFNAAVARRGPLRAAKLLERCHDREMERKHPK